jgi:pyrimidine-specific ribonucleoside hydrolase
MHQDPGDNLDLITAYALPQIDLKAVILDCSEGFRGIKAGLGSDYTDQAGPRDAGFVPALLS